ncbi:nicotinate-nucleotide pyrophosphorylase [carboxylating] [Rhinatrema bivittatum]|uniref:nicotinate-nucleotide pyrophosphorylase [carboxylating] n=1 Tax=Rhinatrema bivittatum TaxID=194408 RepID=UPI0011284AF6|nr:nicotinate-nucleotide pyrophosphorylase [carboxylating] [Rhinatrema bivittatum]XP_029462658.1 nicotinate-nucleotide pyrophosphorylase [carboxylating] [Rhinatrema bivittatum]XP_029462659.1 nicotinate-nucleotide pyrophosphorylase [carboxylating] [Rhinatrema bivittatum]
MASTRAELCHLLHPVALKRLAQDWLQEDIPGFDHAGFVVGDEQETAVLLCKSPGVLAGVPFFSAVFKELDCHVEWLQSEGVWLEPVATAARVRGPARRLLLGERVALNCLARCSGIATASRRVAELAQAAGWAGEVAGTRKTTPGFRLVEKYGMLVGGVSTHRFDLSGMVMLKDNHIRCSGSITQAVQDARKVGGFPLKVEVECCSLEEAQEAAQAGADIVMLDNFSPQAVHSVAQALKLEFPRLVVEASGGVTEKNVSLFFSPHVDVVSLGSLTQAFSAVDYSLKISRASSDPSNFNNSNNVDTSAAPGAMSPPAGTAVPVFSLAPGRRNFAF